MPQDALPILTTTSSSKDELAANDSIAIQASDNSSPMKYILRLFDISRTTRDGVANFVLRGNAQIPESELDESFVLPNEYGEFKRAIWNDEARQLLMITLSKPSASINVHYWR